MKNAAALRNAEPDDAPALRSLTRAAYAKWVPVIGREPLPMTVDYDQAVRENRFDVITVDGQIVGLIETVMHTDHVLVRNIAVAPSCQRQGIGRRLLAHADALAAAAGLAEVRLYTNGKFAGNIALYVRSGYVVTREEPFMDGTVVHMTKRLAA
jgi:ribosomal protein S18 acetylase RimI-like enzyme